MTVSKMIEPWSCAGVGAVSEEHHFFGCAVWLVREGNGTPLQYSCLENPMDGGAWWATVHRVAKSQTGLSEQAQTQHSHVLSIN